MAQTYTINVAEQFGTNLKSVSKFVNCPFQPAEIRAKMILANTDDVAGFTNTYLWSDLFTSGISGDGIISCIKFAGVDPVEIFVDNNLSARCVFGESKPSISGSYQFELRDSVTGATVNDANLFGFRVVIEFTKRGRD